ncbi:putative S-adenosylmethionine carrier 2, chloroplastic, partial [Drosera capensis]
MVSGNDPIESFLNTVQGFKDALLPIECGVAKAAKDLESCWFVLKNGGGSGVGLFGENNGHGGGNGKVKTSKAFVSSLGKKKISWITGDDEKRTGLPVKVPMKTFFGLLSLNCGSKDHSDKGEMRHNVNSRNGDSVKKDGSCANCLQFTLTWSLLLDGFAQIFQSPFKLGKKRTQKVLDEETVLYSSCHKPKQTFAGESRKSEFKESHVVVESPSTDVAFKKGAHASIELFLSFVFGQLNQNSLKQDKGDEVIDKKVSEATPTSVVSPPFDHLKAFTSMFEGEKADMDVFLGNLKFARVGGATQALVGNASPANGGDYDMNSSNREEPVVVSPQKLVGGLLDIPLSNVERLKASGLLDIPLSNVERLKSTLSTVSDSRISGACISTWTLAERYTEAEGRRFFDELDRDGDGLVTLEDLDIAMRKRKLPRRYAREFMRRARSRLFSKSFGWKQFLNLMEQREATILRAYTSLCMTKSGTLKKSEILASLKNAGLPANEENAVAMMRYLNADTEGSISYGHFRNFMLLLPSDRLQDDPRNIWFEAATVVAVAPPVEIPASSVLRSALAGGLSSALSTSLMHPMDTMKTRVQASTLSFPELISRLPQIGVRGLYRGSIPAILGQFTSHGLRTGIFEASKLLLVSIAPALPDIQVQSLASFCSTLLGTATRIPCEVLKQRLQAGIFDNVGEAIVFTWKHDGLKGFFRGTGATLCREVPFYVAGMGLYAESKKLAQHLLGRELEPWETIAVGALSGGIAAVVTTPFDVLKTRTMTAPHGHQVSMAMIAMSILRHEGPLGLFKGAVPRFFWIAPLGAMNFAGYELAKKAMNKSEDAAADQTTQKHFQSLNGSSLPTNIIMNEKFEPDMSTALGPKHSRP